MGVGACAPTPTLNPRTREPREIPELRFVVPQSYPVAVRQFRDVLSTAIEARTRRLGNHEGPPDEATTSRTDAPGLLRSSRLGRDESYAAYVFHLRVNADKSVTIEWALAGTDVSNLSVAVDCCVVRTWPNQDRSARFTTEPLSVGRHTIAIQVLERYWTNTAYNPTSCAVSTNESFRWMCHRKMWTAPMVFLVSASRDPSCIVPVLAGLKLKDAKARIASAHCSLGAMMRKTSNRPSGTVLDQRPKGKMRLANGATVTLVVSNG